MEFEEALALATELATRMSHDPTADIEGLDAGFKSGNHGYRLLISCVTFDDVYTEGNHKRSPHPISVMQKKSAA